MEIEKEIRILNKKYFELYEMLNFCNSRFANMHLRIVGNDKNIEKSAKLISKLSEIIKKKEK